MRLLFYWFLLLSFDFLLLTFALFLYAALVCAGNAHIFSVFCYGAARHLDALRLQDPRDLFIG